LAHKEFTVAHKTIRLDKETVEYKLATIKAQKITKLYVRVGETNFPLKQAFAEASGMPHAGFNSQEAARVLEAVGFTLKEKKPKKNEGEAD
jgi:hypothetical protein